MEFTVKKFSALILCCLMIITCSLAGCAGFTIDKVKYYNEVVAKVGDTNITRYDLVSAYNNYGSTYYVQQQGQSESEAMANTLDLLVDRELLYQYATEHMETYALTEYQVNSIVEKMFESLDSQMKTYTEKAKKILNIETAKESAETKEDEAKVYKYDDYVYTPRAEIKHNENGYYISYKESDEPEFSAIIDRAYLRNYESDSTLTAIINTYFDHYRKSLANEDESNQHQIAMKAIALLADDLIEYEYYLRDENGAKYNTVTKDLIERYFERNYHDQLKSQYLENIRTHYLKNENLSINLLKEEFIDIVEYNYAKYNTHHSAYKDAIKSIGTDGDSVLYHPSLNDGTEFGYFVHTLLSFSDAQKAQLKALENNKNSLTTDQYNLQYNSIVLNTTVNKRDASGKESGEIKTLNAIIADYEDIANANDTLSAFIDFMFAYTGDTATLSAGMPYVVGNNGYSDMEQAFTDECVRLMTEETVGSMSTLKDFTEVENNIANPSTATNVKSLKDYGFVITSYGIHLVYYVNEVSAFDIPYTSINGVYFADDNNSSLNLYYKELNPLTHETYFDMLFDTVYPASGEESNYTSNTGYSDYEEDLVDELQSRVTKNITKIESTKASI